jgi:DNA replicative helicase MCM subunit Mcm2 (Cdc46/Mcm family)
MPRDRCKFVLLFKDEDGNPLQTEFGECKFKDHQSLIVQEMPEKAPTGLSCFLVWRGFCSAGSLGDAK